MRTLLTRQDDVHKGDSLVAVRFSFLVMRNNPVSRTWCVKYLVNFNY
jgi:hypothetical protein